MFHIPERPPPAVDQIVPLACSQSFSREGEPLIYRLYWHQAGAYAVAVVGPAGPALRLVRWGWASSPEKVPPLESCVPRARACPPATAGCTPESEPSMAELLALWESAMPGLKDGAAPGDYSDLVARTCASFCATSFGYAVYRVVPPSFLQRTNLPQAQAATLWFLLCEAFQGGQDQALADLANLETQGAGEFVRHLQGWGAQVLQDAVQAGLAQSKSSPAHWTLADLVEELVRGRLTSLHEFFHPEQADARKEDELLSP